MSITKSNGVVNGTQFTLYKAKSPSIAALSLTLFAKYRIMYLLQNVFHIMKKNKLILIVGIIAILGIGGFIFLQKKMSSPVNQEVKKAQQEVMANCKYDPDFCKYAANGIVALSSGYTMTSESIYNGKTSKTVIKFDGNENSQSVSYSDGKEEGSFISLDKTTYMKGAGEKEWTEFPPMKDETGKPAANLFDFEGLKKELGNATNQTTNSLTVKKVGTESCGTMTCSVFAMTDKSSNTTTKVWVDTTAYLARKMESTTKEGVSTMTFEYGPVTITKPFPIKKIPTSTSNTGDVNTNMNSDQIKNLMKQIPPTNTQPSTEETPVE